MDNLDDEQRLTLGLSNKEFTDLIFGPHIEAMGVKKCEVISIFRSKAQRQYSENEISAKEAHNRLVDALSDSKKEMETKAQQRDWNNDSTS